MTKYLGVTLGDFDKYPRGLNIDKYGNLSLWSPITWKSLGSKFELNRFIGGRSGACYYKGYIYFVPNLDAEEIEIWRMNSKDFSDPIKLGSLNSQVSPAFAFLGNSIYLVGTLIDSGHSLTRFNLDREAFVVTPDIDELYELNVHANAVGYSTDRGNSGLFISTSYVDLKIEQSYLESNGQLGEYSLFDGGIVPRYYNNHISKDAPSLYFSGKYIYSISIYSSNYTGAGHVIDVDDEFENQRDNPVLFYLPAYWGYSPLPYGICGDEDNLYLFHYYITDQDHLGNNGDVWKIKTNAYPTRVCGLEQRTQYGQSALVKLPDNNILRLFGQELTSNVESNYVVTVDYLEVLDLTDPENPVYEEFRDKNGNQIQFSDGTSIVRTVTGQFMATESKDCALLDFKELGWKPQISRKVSLNTYPEFSYPYDKDGIIKIPVFIGSLIDLNTELSDSEGYLDGGNHTNTSLECYLPELEEPEDTNWALTIANKTFNFTIHRV